MLSSIFPEIVNIVVRAGVLIGLIILMVVVLVYYYGMSRDLAGHDVSDVLLDLYITSIDNQNVNQMISAINDMTKYCPYATSNCQANQLCPTCECKFGWKKGLEYRYGETITPYDVSKKLHEESRREE